MATRGLWGFRKQSSLYGIYNHHGSNPYGLGLEVVNLIRTVDKKNLESYFHYLQSHNHLQDLKENKDSPSYDLIKCVTEQIFFQNDIDFIYDSLFCEYAYIMDLDKDILEIYAGFNTDPKEKGPFAKKKSQNEYIDENYYGCRLLCKIPFSTLKKLPTKQIEDIFYLIDSFPSLFSLREKAKKLSPIPLTLSPSECEEITSFFNSLLKTEEIHIPIDQKQKIDASIENDLLPILSSCFEYYLPGDEKINNVHLVRLLFIVDLLKHKDVGSYYFTSISSVISHALEIYDRILYSDLHNLFSITYYKNCIESQISPNLEALSFYRFGGGNFYSSRTVLNLILLKLVYKVTKAPELNKLFNLIVNNKITHCFLDKESKEILLVRFYPIDYVIG